MNTDFIARCIAGEAQSQIEAAAEGYTNLNARLDSVDTAIAEKATVEDIYGGGEIIPDNSDLNNYKTVGVYGVLNSTHAGTISNIPVGGSGFRLIVSGINGGTGYVRQEYIKGNQPGIIYIRHYTGSWTGWYKFEGTTLT